MRSLLTVAVLLVTLAPAHACLNDSVISAEEVAFRERYAQTSPIFIWGRRALVLGGIGTAGMLGVGFWFWYRERCAAEAARVRRRGYPVRARA